MKKKFFVILVLVLVACVSRAGGRERHGGGNHRGFCPPVPRVCLPLPFLPFVPVVVNPGYRGGCGYRSAPPARFHHNQGYYNNGSQVYVTPAPDVGALLPPSAPSGYWAEVIVGYQTVSVPVTLPDGRTAYVPQQQPITRRVWVNQ